MVAKRTRPAKQQLPRGGAVPTPASRPGRGRPAHMARSAARREAILAAALDEFSVCGFEAARIDDVARRAAIAKGTVYLYCL